MRVKREKREKGLQSPPSTAHHPKTVVVADGLRQQYYKIILSSTIYNPLPRGLVTVFLKVFFVDCISAGQKGCNNPGKF